MNVPCANIARWDGTTWAALGGGLNGQPENAPFVMVRTLATYDGELIAGGNFTTAGDIPCAAIARWDGTQWGPLGDGLVGEDPGVVALGVYNGELYVASQFPGPRSWGSVQRWDGAQWHRFISGSVYAYAFANYRDELIIAGFISAHTVVRWDGSSLQPLSRGTNSAVRALAVHDGALVLGGDFSSVMAEGYQSYMSRYWARWGPPQPVGDLNCDGRVDLADINPFVLALVDPAVHDATYPGCPSCSADCNHDNHIDFRDIDPFVELLVGGR